MTVFSLQTINAIQDEATRKASRAKKFPIAPTEAELDSNIRLATALQQLPFVGEYVHPRWEQARDEDGDPIEWFVDSSGYGADNEPALSQRRFLEDVRVFCKEHPGAAFAITQAGQFQVYVGVYLPKPK